MPYPVFLLQTQTQNSESTNLRDFKLQSNRTKVEQSFNPTHARTAFILCQETCLLLFLVFSYPLHDIVSAWDLFT